MNLQTPIKSKIRITPQTPRKLQRNQTFFQPLLIENNTIPLIVNNDIIYNPPLLTLQRQYAFNLNPNSSRILFAEEEIILDINDEKTN
jgi:hypothetical protein